MISVIITIFIFVSITITLLNSILLYKKDFGVHYLTGARTIDIIKIISGELFILSFVAIILSTPIFIFKGLTNKINVIALLSTFIFLLIMNLIILIIPIVNINKIQLNQLIKGED
ncbi:FtsX-like permease family protein [Clostridium septicum]|nr:FtsX-like permease family protein [Clostridium septicum]